MMDREVNALFPIRFGQLARLIGGSLVRGQPRAPVRHAVYGNTKYLRSGVVFFAKENESIRRQLHELKHQSCARVIVSPGWRRSVPQKCPLIVVPDTKQAVWRLALWQRNRSDALFIGITGSAGKTTTKEMTAAILAQKYPTMKSYANNNIASCLPGNLMRLKKRHRVAVLEMGMSSLGNIRRQCQYTRPEVGVVTNVGEAHVGSLGNSLDNVVRAKQELVDGLSPGGTLILNADDPGSQRLRTQQFRGRILTFGIRHPATVRAKKIRFLEDGMHFRVGPDRFHIPTWGKHNVYNALAAIAVGKHLGIPIPDIQRGLQTYSSPHMRLQRIRGIRNYTLINDAYNANPTSMTAGLQVLKRMAKENVSVAVLGDMHELGLFSSSAHRRVGVAVAKLNPDRLLTIGPRAVQIARTAIAKGYPSENVCSLPHRFPAAAHIRRFAPPGSYIYFKASRKIKLEKVVKQLRRKGNG
ncbi:UDP-N-acetylmuramoyl-tripeptide--D-alanyl-D-alanine ligase [Paludifilum halophilum]|uniref:UDP-N-acetylmuramoyl-tripeptide--D-alanyl-D-alanine ligase n=1 Tax=Paludifilum halophilum TaxID=1642702 RepID=A0A235BC18_9BACL|nr:UDP-N-acetylmuramoyl-tripeptide--D-alanyl-D-alanine ligase [Paludifilum halophilum]OYD09569.1 hypothetical protein CHM34_00695 [Paludifilum halophilum]